MRSRADLFPHQQAAVARLAERPQQCALLKMGSGKTAVALTALVDRPAVRRVLVMAPAPVVERDVWGREAKTWSHTQHVHVHPLCGTLAQRQKKLDAALLSEFDGGVHLHVVSYESALWLTDAVSLDTYDAVIFDELSKLKAPGTARFKRLRARVLKVPVRIGLTGSPVGNALVDLWGEVFMCVGEGSPLGSSYAKYLAEYFCNTSFDPRYQVWELRVPEMERTIFERCKDVAFSLPPGVAEALLPPVHVTALDYALPASVRALGEKLAQECRAELESGTTLEALSASAKHAKLRQLASGATYFDPLDETKPWETLHTVKIEALREVLDEQQGEPVLCFYWYQHELARLQAAFPEARLATDQGALDAWDRREVKLLLAHPQSAGHGLNLQAGGSTVVWFTLPYSHELWEQGNGRLARPGQTAPYVSALTLCCGEFDRAVLDLLREKGALQSRFLETVALDPLLADPLFW